MVEAANKRNKFLLTSGLLAGPVYVFVSLAEILTREGFDITRHSWSVLSNGDFGWIHVTNFFITGLLTILGAVGIRHVLKGKKGGTWAPILLTIFGLGLIAGGIFKADPVDGFPPGTPLGIPTTFTTNGMLHLAFGSIGFWALIIACIIFFRHFRSLGQNHFAWFSLATGIYFLIGFMSTIVGAGFGQIGLTVSLFAFTAAVILAWVWHTLLYRHFIKTEAK